MARQSKRRKDVLEGREIGGLIVVYARLREEDYEELKRREEKTGAPIAAQIRILVREALRAGKKVIQ